MRGEFIEYVKLVENGGKVGFDGETWFPRPSPEGGNDTIAYGHKLKNDETWMKVGISDSDAENLLISDLQIAAEGASNVISEFGRPSNKPKLYGRFLDAIFTPII